VAVALKALDPDDSGHIDQSSGQLKFVLKLRDFSPRRVRRSQRLEDNPLLVGLPHSPINNRLVRLMDGGFNPVSGDYLQHPISIRQLLKPAGVPGSVAGGKRATQILILFGIIDGNWQ
jgi:hypothetical protein